MKLKEKFTLDSNLISEFLADFATWNDEGSLVKDILETNNTDYDDEFDLSMFEGLETWRFNIKSGYYVHDGDNNDNDITIVNPETGDCYFGYDNHNLMNGWSDVVMTYVKYDPKTDMVEISKYDLDKMKERLKWLGYLESAGVDNWSGYSYAWELMNDDNSQGDR